LWVLDVDGLLGGAEGVFYGPATGIRADYLGVLGAPRAAQRFGDRRLV